jgi:hypothetical protein
MATLTAQPPPSADAEQSHQERRHSGHKKRSDPFLELRDDTLLLQETTSASNNDHVHSAGTWEALLADVGEATSICMRGTSILANARAA